MVNLVPQKTMRFTVYRQRQADRQTDRQMRSKVNILAYKPTDLTDAMTMYAIFKDKRGQTLTQGTRLNGIN